MLHIAHPSANENTPTRFLFVRKLSLPVLMLKLSVLLSYSACIRLDLNFCSYCLVTLLYCFMVLAPLNTIKGLRAPSGGLCSTKTNPEEQHKMVISE